MAKLTKEKVLALAAIIVALLMLANEHLPSVEAVPAVPDEERPRTYRSVASTPRLSPEEPFKITRDPFRSQDPWQEADPALLAVPSAKRWPRAMPGGLVELPRGAQDRLLIEKDPVEVKQEEEDQ